MKKYIPVLSIAGSDSSGGAGIQADIKTISSLGCYAMTAITAITAQNTCGVTDIMEVRPATVDAQIDAVCSDIRPLAVKTGMLFNSEIVAVVADAIKRHRLANVVVDPVMVSTSGSTLLAAEAQQSIINRLLPLADIVTPNYREAIALTGETDPDVQARRILEMGCKNVLIKGGDIDSGNRKVDFLLQSDGHWSELESSTVATRNTHGTGCTLSSAIASMLAMGHDIAQSVALAREYIHNALIAGADVECGSGHGPVNHFFSPQPLKKL